MVPGRGLRDRLLQRPRARSRPPRSAPPGRSGSPPRAVPAARRAIREREADAVLGGGGYVAAPAGLAALSLRPAAGADRGRPPPRARQPPARPPRASRLPRVPDPGREGERYLVTGRPVPAAVGAADRAGARERFADRRRSIAACSSSAAARARARSTSARSTPSPATRPAESVPRAPYQRAAATTPRPEAGIEAAGRAERYTLLEYEPNLADALAASDLVLARAGGSVFELAAAGRPAILVPYPHATARHQHANAAWMADAGAAVVIEDAELDRRGCARSPASLLGDPERLARDGGRLPGARPPRRRRAHRGRVLAAIRQRFLVDDAGELSGRELHFIAIGGAGMSGLALVCHAARRDGDRQRPRRELLPRAPASRRARAAGRPRRRRRPGGRRGGRLDRDRRRQPRARASAASAASGCIHRGELLAELCATKRLIAVAGTHGKTTTAGMLAHALRAIGADPAFFLGGELPGAGDGGEPANAGVGARASGSSPRPTSPTRASSRCGPRSRWSPTSSSTTTPAGRRGPS